MKYRRRLYPQRITSSQRYQTVAAISTALILWSIPLLGDLPQVRLTGALESDGALWNRTAQASTQLSTGTQIRLNGRLFNGAWQQQENRIGILDGVLSSQLGLDFLDSSDPRQQPIAWFPSQNQSQTRLPSWHTRGGRYLDITALADARGWQLKSDSNVLDIALPDSQIVGVRQGRQPWGGRLVLDLSAPASWQTTQVPGQITIAVDAAGGAATQTFKPNLKEVEALSTKRTASRTILELKVTDNIQAHTWSLSNPDRLVIDLRPDALNSKDIAWARGLRWQEIYVALGSSRFPIYALTIEPEAGASLLPIWTTPDKATGTTAPGNLAQQWLPAAFINAGFFNRNNQLPLGAVRYNYQWISGPILGRGAIAWDNEGRTAIDRFTLATTAAVAGQRFPVVALNSGYVRAGISQYTRGWGSSYTNINDHEIIVTVVADQVVGQQTTTAANQGSIPIPEDGYLLVFRSFKSGAQAFSPGSAVSISQQPSNSLGQLPHMLGAGPLLLKQNRVVLNPQQESFSSNFIQGQAARSAIGITSSGSLKLVAIQNRIGGRGPTLRETALLMQRLGCVDALNLDGGSSSALYLSGQLLNRDARTAARINNAAGVFLPVTPD